jgi:hypothetical protein
LGRGFFLVDPHRTETATENERLFKELIEK